MNGNNALVKIMGKEVSRIEYRDQPVVTFRMIDDLHERPESTARKAFNRNRERFIEGEDFFDVPFEDWSQIIAVPLTDGDTDETSENNLKQRNPIKFLTQSGYLMLAKVFTDDLAWKVQRELVKCYFAVKQYKKKFRTDWDERLAQSEETRRVCRVADNTIKAQRTAEGIVAQIAKGTAKLEDFKVNEEVMKYVDRYLGEMEKKRKLADQGKNMNLDPGLVQFWHNVLSEGRIPGGNSGGVWVRSNRVYTEYLNFMKERNIHGRILYNNRFSGQLKQICPFTRLIKRAEERKVHRGIIFPSLEICRQSFIETIGYAVEFDRKNAMQTAGNA